MAGIAGIIPRNIPEYVELRRNETSEQCFFFVAEEIAPHPPLGWVRVQWELG